MLSLVKLCAVLCVTLLLGLPSLSYAQKKPLRVGVVGLVHDHVHQILRQLDREDLEIVGIVEPDKDLVDRYAKRYGFDRKLVYDSLEAMLDQAKPEAVTVFTSIYDHLRVTQASAERGIHVMVEKPLAVSMEHARAMAAAATQHGIHLLTNYETTWYPSVHEARALVQDSSLGALRKIVVHDGHQGPKEIGVSQEFFAWLTDPVQNGGGALIDFGCYGADLITWLMNGQRPTSVTAVTQQIKPGIYPKVDDEATIIVTYPQTQGIIQASWNWPFNRKDMEVYGRTGSVYARNATDMQVRREGEEAAQDVTLTPREAPYNDPFAYFAAVVRGDVTAENSLSSLPVNMIVVEILETARESARTGRTITLEPD